jgi:hypothetical protein
VNERTEMNQISVGVWIWGAATTILAAASLAFVVASAFYVMPGGRFRPNAPSFMPRMYTALKDNGSLVAGILGFSVLAWAHFFAVNNHQVTLGDYKERVPKVTFLDLPGDDSGKFSNALAGRTFRFDRWGSSLAVDRDDS